jgi:ABC-type glycerol-3-phosphate transport system substrate-binding protein
MFNEDGIGRAPSSWQELQTMARKLTHVDANGSVQRYGLTFGGSDTLLAHELITLIWGNGGEYVDETGKVKLNSSPVAEVLQSLTDMVLSNTAVIRGSGGLVKDINAMSLMPTYQRQTLVNTGGSDYKNLRSIVIPPNKGQPVAYHYSYGFYVSKQSRNAEEAWRFLRWLTMERADSSRTRMGELMATIGSLPTNAVDISALAGIQKDPFYEGFLPSLNVARNEPLLPEMARRHQVISAAIGPVFKGAISVSSALDQLQQQIETILAGHK